MFQLLNNHEKDTWAKMVKKNPNASILDILKVNRAELRWIRSKDDKEKDYAYKCVKSGQSYKLNLNQLDKVFAVKGLYDMDILVKNTNKICSYLHRQNITVSEYKHYKRLLTDNGFPMDNSNLYPKDFRKAEMRVMDEIDMIKAKAHEKLDNYTIKIGYPDKWKDYSTLEVGGGKNYYENLRAASQ